MGADAETGYPNPQQDALGLATTWKRELSDTIWKRDTERSTNITHITNG
jgi:hypothetical protein